MNALQEIRSDIIREEVGLAPLNWEIEMDKMFRLWIKIDGLNSKIQLRLPKGIGLSCYLSILKSQSETGLDNNSQSKIFETLFTKIYAKCSKGNDLDASKEYLKKTKLKDGTKNWTEAFSKQIHDLNKTIKIGFCNYPQIVNELRINTENEIKRIKLHPDRISAGFWDRFKLD